jgi:hypothetical protein
MRSKLHDRISLRRRQHGQVTIPNLMAMFQKKKDPVVDPNAKKEDIDQTTGKPRVKAEDIDQATGLPRVKSQPGPLDMFAGLFDNTNKTGDDAQPSFSLDPEKLQKIAGQLDFTGQLSPEDIEGLKSGDPAKTAAILNRTGQNAYSMLMQHLPALTEKFVTARLEHSQSKLGGQVKSTLTKQALEKLAANNPILKQQMETISEELLGKFPDATPDWIAEQTKAYFVEMARVVSPDLFRSEDELKGAGKPKRDPKDVSQTPDFSWGAYLGNEQSKK